MTPALPGRHTPRTARNLIPLVLAPAALALLGACSPDDGTVSAEAPPSAVSTTVTATTTPVTVPLTATLPPVLPTDPTVAPSEPVTTLPPLTLPETTLPPTTAVPTTTVPPNVEVIGPASVPLEAVGTRDGEATAAIQQRLVDMGFWLSAVDGVYGLTTRQAVMAFQKYIGLPANGKVDEQTAAFLQHFGERAHGTADTGDLIEVDKDKQLLFIVRGGKTVWTLNTSTGNGQPYEEEDQNSPGEIQRGVSLTPNGLWKVNRERAEGWWEGDLGQIYRPKYFRGGVAVHGSNSIPEYPASHGCVRVSVPAMDWIWAENLMPMQTVVWVHGAN